MGWHRQVVADLTERVDKVSVGSGLAEVLWKTEAVPQWAPTQTLKGRLKTCPRLSASCVTFLGRFKQFYFVLALPRTHS